MSLRRRLALLSALAVALAVLLASALVYALVRDRLYGEIDKDLRRQANRVTGRIDAGPAPFGGAPGGSQALGPPGVLPPQPGATESTSGTSSAEERREAEEGERFSLALPPPEPGGPAALGQLVRSDGSVVTEPGASIRIPVSGADRELAANGGAPRIGDVEAGGTSLRVLTQPVAGGAVQVARSLEDTEDTLNTLVIILALVSAGGIGLAAALGPVVARASLAPAAQVSDAAEEVARTHDLTHRIEVRGDDELGRLAASFNEMMAALERSEAAQRRLVADASHELRTPLATLRTNIEILGRSEQLDPAERKRLVGDLTDELEEMTDLVGDVVELARQPGQGELARQDIALDELTGDAVDRAQRRWRGIRFERRLSPSLVHADAQRLGRAITNMLDNACKWSPEGGTVEVELEGGRVTVRDHGPGFPAAGLDKVFDRFWRSDEARGKPGSGLGLAIVQRVAEEHGGAVRAENAADGGAVVTVELPELEAPKPEAAS